MRFKITAIVFPMKRTSVCSSVGCFINPFCTNPTAKWISRRPMMYRIIAPRTSSPTPVIATSTV